MNRKHVHLRHLKHHVRGRGFSDVLHWFGSGMHRKHGGDIGDNMRGGWDSVASFFGGGMLSNANIDKEKYRSTHIQPLGVSHDSVSHSHSGGKHLKPLSYKLR